MGLNRRSFLQQAGSSLITPLMWGGITQNKSWFNAYGETLAQTTSRKLALLVGINQYPDSNNLRGCLTDVELQRELLIYRFGFNPQDILILTDKEATREAIETAFLEHLVTQATNNDVVVFHFSGYGRQVQINSPPETVVNSLIPRDGILPSVALNIANDVLMDTLMYLGQTLPTEKLTMILDTSYQSCGQNLLGNFWVRSYNQDSPAESVSPEEIAFLERIKQQTKSKLVAGKFPGLILSAAKKKGIAYEIVGNGLNAGLFTYCLTQYLWESTSPQNIWLSLQNITSAMVSLSGTRQIPELTISKRKPSAPAAYYLTTPSNNEAEAMVTDIFEGGSLGLDLVGLSPLLVFNYGVNSCFSFYQQGELINSGVQIRSREGRKAKGKLIASKANIQVGTKLQESIRVLPRDSGLIVALDPKLERIERVDATSALSSIAEVATVVNPGEDFADCVLGKLGVDSAYPGSYALFSATGLPFPHTVSKNPNEAVSAAVRRLIPHFQTLLAVKILHLTLNQASSRLPVSASLELRANPPKVLISQETTRILPGNYQAISQSQVSPLNSSKQILPGIALGSQIGFQLTNYTGQNIYTLLLGINSSGKAFAITSPQGQEISPEAKISIPERESPLKWTVDDSKGLVQLFVIGSQFPFPKTLVRLYDSTSVKSDREQMIILDDPIPICQALLEDLHLASGIKSDIITNITDIYALDINRWASLSFVFEVV